MKAREITIEIRALDDGARCALLIDGLTRYVGSRDECHRRAEIIVRAQRGDRERQDQMLARGFR